MKYAVIGGGPAGLYFALLAKKANPSDEVLVVERNPPDATFGWGVVFSEETLGALREADDESYVQIAEQFARWNAIDIFYGETRVRSRGHVFTGISRKVLLRILQERCRSLDVRLEFRRELIERDLDGLTDYDLLVGADGVNGLVRRRWAEQFQPTIRVHPTKYVWFGADLALDAFTFIFRRTPHGLFQVHAYPFDAHTSTFIVECPESVWRAAGLDRADEAASIAYCERLFAPELQGHHLMSNRSLWINFPTLRSVSWHHENVVLVGDAAHTAHFSIGSGTKLAMEDSIALVAALRRRRELEAALTDFELERQPIIDRFQEAAEESAGYFEHVARYAGFAPVQFAFNLLTRSRRISYLNLSQRDPALVRQVDAWFSGHAAGPEAATMRLSPPPMFVPFQVRSVELTNRVVITAGADLADGTASGAGLLLSDFTAVTADGRITPETPCLCLPDQLEVLRAQVARVRSVSQARVALQLGHAGRRGSMRSRAAGVDRPLRSGGWELISASAIPFTTRATVPRAMNRADVTRVIDAFAASARAAAEAGVDVLELNFGQGYLVASFISPLTNRRTDDYGGSIGNRLRFPLQVLDAVRGVWPGPLIVRLTASDGAAGGVELDEALCVSMEIKVHGADLIHPVLGQTVAESGPGYARLYAVPASDRIRNEAGISTLASGGLTSSDDVNTILAAGRADLCLMEFPGRA